MTVALIKNRTFHTTDTICMGQGKTFRSAECIKQSQHQFTLSISRAE